MTDETNILPTNSEDTEGHAASRKFMEPAGENDTMDTEGHMPYRKGPGKPAGENDTEDTEGHKKNFRFVDAGEDDTVDTEGHGIKAGRIQPADDGGDIGGHINRPGR